MSRVVTDDDSFLTKVRKDILEIFKKPLGRLNDNQIVQPWGSRFHAPSNARSPENLASTEQFPQSREVTLIHQCLYDGPWFGVLWKYREFELKLFSSTQYSTEMGGKKSVIPDKPLYILKTPDEKIQRSKIKMQITTNLPDPKQATDEQNLAIHRFLHRHPPSCTLSLHAPTRKI